MSEGPGVVAFVENSLKGQSREASEIQSFVAETLPRKKNEHMHATNEQTTKRTLGYRWVLSALVFVRIRLLSIIWHKLCSDLPMIGHSNHLFLAFLGPVCCTNFCAAKFQRSLFAQSEQGSAQISVDRPKKNVALARYGCLPCHGRDHHLKS